MILVFGSINVDLVARVEEIARPGETVLSDGYELFHGGKGANQAVAAARTGAPGSVAMCGAIGADAFGEDCRANLEREGVDVSALQTVEARTGSAFISVDASGENAITVASGANRLIEAGRLDDRRLASVGVAVLQMEVPMPANLALARRLRSAGARVILNFAPARAGIDRADLRALLGCVDHLVVNEHEAATLCAMLGLVSEHGGGQGLSQSLGLSVVVTLGAGGVDLHGPGAATFHCDAVPVDVVDTTGAGDTFVGVFASGLDAGMPVPDAIERAGRAASLSCTRSGAQSGMPTLAQLGG